MFRKLGHVLLIVALVAAVGGHWAVLQTVAWTNMLAGNLRAASVTESFEKTFDGQHPCRLCKAIKEGKKSEQKSELPMPLQKIEFVSEQPVFVFNPPQDFFRLPERAFSLDNLSSQPPAPPLRPTQNPRPAERSVVWREAIDAHSNPRADIQKLCRPFDLPIKSSHFTLVRSHEKH